MHFARQQLGLVWFGYLFGFSDKIYIITYDDKRYPRSREPARDVTPLTELQAVCLVILLVSYLDFIMSKKDFLFYNFYLIFG